MLDRLDPPRTVLDALRGLGVGHHGLPGGVGLVDDGGDLLGREAGGAGFVVWREDARRWS